MKRKFTMLLSIVIFIYITTLSSNKVYADEKEYEIPSADFHVTLLKNGDALVTENWKVKYTKGNFTRFYKDIYKNVSAIEDFSNIEVKNCKINGKEVSEAKSMNREHNHYYIETTYDSYSINWFYEASNELVEYEITYLLSDIVKTNNNKALFCYRFIGSNFEKRVENTYVEIFTPAATSIDLQYGNEDNYKKENNCIFLTQNNVKGLLKYRIAMDSTIFTDLQYISQENADSEDNDEKFSLIKIIFIILSYINPLSIGIFIILILVI